MGQIDAHDDQSQQDALKLVERLSGIANDSSSRSEVIAILDQLAVILRNDAIRAPLGQTDLPRLLVDLSREKDDELIRQVGRVAANLVIGYDNRESLVIAGYIDSILSTAAFESKNALEPRSSTLPLVASLHNLIIEKNASAISAFKQDLYLRTLLDFTQQWTNTFYHDTPSDPTVTIIRWSWSILSILLEEPPSSLGSSTLDNLICPFSASSSNIDTHLHILTCASDILEAILTPDGPLRQQVQSKLGTLLDFLETAEVPEEVQGEVDDHEEGSEDEETPDRSKSMGTAKAAIIRVLVGLSSDIPPDSSFWVKMRLWLSLKDRSDLVNCALLSYGNSVKDASSAISLLEGENSLLPVILPLLSHSTPATTQHAVIGLARNLSVPMETKRLLGEAGVIDKLAQMNVWVQEKDLLGSVQGGAAVILKNMCRNDVANSERFLTRPLDPLLDLIKRAEDPALRFECTRLLVNVIKSLALAKQSLDAVKDQRVVESLARMLVDGAQYMILQSEAVIALTLLSTFGGGEMSE
uniref:UNC-45/Cro1/She4 central domain-containing protein n=1 Tax=Kwoniella bestiolae CBS 10118 TaxID=1296100 RepID=A0A1B9FVW8_9TREE|nr:hypothetical protein I302_07255 [Kwoniella bestiolae CBS 10118]OCF22905.1 hypothetical protein I302_07255 [Kwoniella bestiolae CBS 10118]